MTAHKGINIPAKATCYIIMFKLDIFSTEIIIISIEK